MGRQVLTNSRETPTQFLPVAPIPSIAKRTEPLETVGLADDGSRPYHLPALAPGVARGPHVIQPAKGRGQIVSLRQGAAGPPPASRRCRRPPRHFPFDPPALRFACRA